jgi:hypothetical protein
MFDQRRQTFNPVAVVAVQHIIDCADFGMVDVAANHALCAASFCFACNR